MSDRTGPFLLRDYEGEYLSQISGDNKVADKAIETLISHQVDLNALNVLSTQILEELNLSSETDSLSASSGSGNVGTDETGFGKPLPSASGTDISATLSQDDPVRLLMEDYRRVCQKNEELVNMIQGLHQMNTDLSFFTQNVLNKLAQVAPSEVPTLPSHLSSSLQSPPVSTSDDQKTSPSKAHTFFVPSVFNDFLMPPNDLSHDCEVCQEIMKLMSSLSDVISGSKPEPKGIEDINAAKIKVEDDPNSETVASSQSKPVSSIDSDCKALMEKEPSEDEIRKLNEALRRILARDSLIGQIARDEKGSWKASSDNHLDTLAASLTKAALKSQPVRIAQTHAQDSSCGRASKVLVWTIAAALVAYMLGGKHIGPSGEHFS